MSPFFFYGLIVGMFVGAIGGFVGGALTVGLCNRRVPRRQRGVENPPTLRQVRRGGPTGLQAGPRRRT